MKLKQKGGITSKIIRVFLQDATSLTGAGLTGLTNASAGLTAYYIREGAATATQIALTAGTVGTWSSTGFKEVDAVNMPGLYELGLPNAAVAAGAASVTVYLKGATNLVPCLVEMELDAVDYQDGIHFGLTSLPNAAANAANGLHTFGTGAGQLNVDGSGNVLLGATSMDAMLTDVTSDSNARSSGMHMLRALFNRFYNVVTQTASQQKIYNDSNTLVSTMTTSDDSTTATKGKSA